MHGKKSTAFQHGCCSSRWTVMSLKKIWPIQLRGAVFSIERSTHVLRRVYTAGEANIGTVRRRCPAYTAP